MSLQKRAAARTRSEFIALTEADQIIATLELLPHPEGGHYRETFRDGADASGRSASTAILYLLKKGEVSHWHRIDAVEIWHWYAGAPLELTLSADGIEVRKFTLGNSLGQGHQPQVIVPRTWWQSARSLGEYALVGCTVAPGFEFSGFEMAPPGWRPGRGP
jgi:uncharacterized protein